MTLHNLAEVHFFFLVAIFATLVAKNFCCNYWFSWLPCIILSNIWICRTASYWVRILKPTNICVPYRYWQVQFIIRQISSHPLLLTTIDIPYLDYLIFASNCQIIIASLCAMSITFLMHLCFKNFIFIIINLTSFCHDYISYQSFYLFRFVNNLFCYFFAIEVLNYVTSSTIFNEAIFMYLQIFYTLIFFLRSIFSNLFARNWLLKELV